MPITGFKHSEKTKEKLRKMSLGKNNPNYGRPVSQETREKIRRANLGRKRTLEQRANLSKAHKGMKPPGFKGRKHSEETKSKISNAINQLNHDSKHRKTLSDALASPEYRGHHSEVMKEVWARPEYKTKIAQMNLSPELHTKRSKVSMVTWSKPEVRAKITGPNHYNWRGGRSFKSYCPKFNKALKEEIREAFGRKCYLCSTTEEENARKLDVHHCDYNKGQGCGQRWSLLPLCKKCHSKTNHHRHYYFNLLANYWALNPDITF